MKRFLAMLLAFALVLTCAPVIPLQVNAATEGYYTYTVSNGEATITDCDTSISGDIIIPSTLGGYPVTSIGNEAFKLCTILSSVTISDSIISIGDSAFYACHNLNSINIGSSVTTIGNEAFRDCVSLTSITIPDSVTSIGDSAFWYCTRLESITIGNSVTSIGDYVFQECSSLASVTIPSSVISMGDCPFFYCTSLTGIWVDEGNTVYCSDEYGVLFDKDKITLLEAPCSIADAYTISDSVTRISHRAFYGCNSMPGVTIPEGVASIDFMAFGECTSLTDVYYNGTQEQWNAINIESANEALTNATIHYNEPAEPEETVVASGTCGENVTWSLNDKGTLTISGTGAMTSTPWTDYNTAINSVIIEDGVTTIADSAFTYCSSLTSVTIADSVTSIGDSAFYYCSRLTDIEIPDRVTSIGSWAFSYCDSLTDITLPDGIKGIGYETFLYCTNLASVEVPDSITSISAHAFSRCYSLESIEIPDGVTTIGSCAFYECSSLEKVEIPDSVTSIGNEAFMWCSDLESVIIGNGVTSIGNEVFNGCGNLTDLTIGNSVTTIGDDAFFGCSSLESVKLPDGVTGIGDYAFRYCSSLTSITIPDSITTIGYSAFTYCSSLTDVYYGGTLEQWNEIDIGSDNEDLTNATLHTVERSLTEISVKTLPNKTKYWMGEDLDTTGLTLTLHYSDGSTKDITEGFSVGGFDSWMYGLQMVYVEYEGYSTSFEVTVIAPVELSVKTLPDKTEYWMGEELDTTGLVLTLHYSDGSTKDITEGFYVESWFDPYMYGTQTVSVGYEDFYTSFEVIVIAPISLSVKTLPDKTEYFRYESLDTKGLVLTVTYSDGTVKDITEGYYIEWFDSYMTGVQTVYVNYEGMMTSFEVTVINGGYCGDNLYWELDEATGVLTISGTGAMSDWNNPWNEWSYSITSVVIEEGVTNIGRNAFTDCYEMTEITIPDSVTYIGENAFSNCSNLTSITIPDGVQSIDNSAFYGCNNLTSIEIPDSVTYIGDYAFSMCSSLTEIDLPSNITYIGYSAFFDSGLTHITIPENVTYIASQTFSECTNLVSVTIGENVTSIGYDAFYNCTGLTTVNYQGYEENKSNMMIDSGNDALVSANWIYRSGVVRTGIVVKTPPEKTEYWVNEELDTTGLVIWVQYSDNFLITITEGFTVSNVDTSTAGAKTVTVTYKDLTTTFDVTVKDKSGTCGRNVTWALSEDGVLTISGTGDMYDYQYGLPDWYELRANITSIVIEDGVTGLGAYAFCYLANVTEVSIADSVSFIGQGAFESCSSLTQVVIPSSLTELKDYVFFRCYGLSQITLPVSVTSIGEGAFYGCRLTTVDYSGNQKQMLQITIGQNNESLMSASWNCNNQEGDPVLTGIAIKTSPAKTEYMLYESLDTTGLVLTVFFSDGSGVEITSGFTVSGFDSYLVGNQVLEVSYGGFTDYFDVKIICGGTFGDNLTWVLDDNGVLTISGTGAISDWSDPWWDWRYSIRSVVIEEGVTRIGAYAFSWCDYMTEVTIPASVTSIGEGAFDSCYVLQTVHYGGMKNQKSDIFIDEWNECLANATWYFPAVAVHQQGDTRKEYDSLEEALAAATDGTVSLLMDVTEKTVAIKPGVTLDLSGYTLTADLVVGLNGAVILDGGEDCTGGGLLKTGQYSLVYAPGEGQQVIPVWNGVNGYIFTKVTVLELTQDTGVEGTARYMFLPRFSNSEAAALLSDGGLNNGLKFRVCMTWADGKSQMFYTYDDSLVSMVYDGTGRLAFSLTITGIADITDAVVTAEIVTDSGAIASSEGLGI